MKILLTSPALLESGGRLLQVSTDFVFNGQQGSQPHRPEQARDPPEVILRTSWAMGLFSTSA